MKNEEFFEELKGILSDYTSKSKVLAINNNIDQLLAYWNAGAILEEVYEDKSCNYDEWYCHYAVLLEEYYSYDVGEVELMRKLYVNFDNILNLPVIVSWEHLKLIIQLDEREEIEFYLSKVEEENLSV